MSQVSDCRVEMLVTKSYQKIDFINSSTKIKTKLLIQIKRGGL